MDRYHKTLEASASQSLVSPVSLATFSNSILHSVFSDTAHMMLDLYFYLDILGGCFSFRDRPVSHFPEIRYLT